MLVHVMSPALFVGCTNTRMIGCQSTALVTASTILERHLYSYNHCEHDYHPHETHPTTLAATGCCPYSLIWINRGFLVPCAVGFLLARAHRELSRDVALVRVVLDVASWYCGYYWVAIVVLCIAATGWLLLAGPLVEK